MMSLPPIDDLLPRVRQGGMLILVDDERRENEEIGRAHV